MRRPRPGNEPEPTAPAFPASSSRSGRRSRGRKLAVAFFGGASSRLGRPMSTPWAMRSLSVSSRSGRRLANNPTSATLALPVAGSSGTPLKRREHARLNVDAAALIFDIEQDAGRAVGLQMLGKYLRARPRRRQRRARLQFGESQRKPAGGDTGRVIGRVDILSLERACRRHDIGVNIVAALNGCGGVNRAPTSEPPSLIRSSRTKPAFSSNSSGSPTARPALFARAPGQTRCRHSDGRRTAIRSAA